LLLLLLVIAFSVLLVEFRIQTPRRRSPPSRINIRVVLLLVTSRFRSMTTRINCFWYSRLETVATTNVGNNADLSYTTGNSKSGVSKAELSGTMAATGAQFRIVRVSKDPENSTTGSANANVIVRIDEHFYGTETGV
jgi:hypothetical protein